MRVEVFHDINNFDSFDLSIGSVREALNALTLHKGADYVEAIINDKHKFVLYALDGSREPVYLSPEVVFSPFEGFDGLMIVPEIGGEVTAAAVAGVIGVAATSWTAIIVAAVINLAISVALSVVVQMLSPTIEFSNDPAFAQQNQSSLFNGAPIIREQGGSVPIVFGNPYCGGVLISSGVTTAEG